MSIQMNPYVVKEGAAVVSLQAKKVATDNSPEGKDVASKQHAITANAGDANARFDSYIARGAYGFLAMKL